MTGLIADADDTTWSVISHYALARKNRRKRDDVRTQALDSLVTRALHAELLRLLREDRDDTLYEIDDEE